jgi:anti-anti-sigma regulatory factor
MLRITVDNGGEVLTIKLEGELVGPWVEAAERAWLDAIAKAAKSVTVDLSEVTFLDEDGKELLARMCQQGAELRPDRLMTKYVVDQIVQRAKDSKKHGGVA